MEADVRAMSVNINKVVSCISNLFILLRQQLTQSQYSVTVANLESIAWISQRRCITSATPAPDQYMELTLDIVQCQKLRHAMHSISWAITRPTRLWEKNILFLIITIIYTFNSKEVCYWYTVCFLVRKTHSVAV